MKVTYDYTAADFTVYQKEGMKALDISKIYTLLFALLSVLFVMADMILVLVAIAKNDGSIYISDIPSGILIRGAIGVAISGVLWIVGTVVQRVGNKTAADAGPNGVYCQHTVEIRDDGFTEKTALNTYFMSWKGVDALNETASFFIIQVRLSFGYPIPKHAFASSESMENFANTVRSKISVANAQSPNEPSSAS